MEKFRVGDNVRIIHYDPMPLYEGWEGTVSKVYSTYCDDGQSIYHCKAYYEIKIKGREFPDLLTDWDLEACK